MPEAYHAVLASSLAGRRRGCDALERQDVGLGIFGLGPGRYPPSIHAAGSTYQAWRRRDQGIRLENICQHFAHFTASDNSKERLGKGAGIWGKHGSFGGKRPCDWPLALSSTVDIAMRQDKPKRHLVSSSQPTPSCLDATSFWPSLVPNEPAPVRVEITTLAQYRIRDWLAIRHRQNLLANHKREGWLIIRPFRCHCLGVTALPHTPLFHTDTPTSTHFSPAEA